LQGLRKALCRLALLWTAATVAAPSVPALAYYSPVAPPPVGPGSGVITTGVPTVVPRITSMGPFYGNPGDLVTLGGTGFLGVQDVAFGAAYVPVNETLRGAGGSTSDTTMTVPAPFYPPGTSVQVGIPGTGATAPAIFTYDIASMDAEGPLPYYLNGCVGCADPWAQNHSITGPGNLYPAYATYPWNAPHGSPIVVITPTPTFYVDATFSSTGFQPGATTQLYSGVADVMRGDVANFYIALQTCVAPPADNAPQQPQCQDAVGNAGLWRSPGVCQVAASPPANPDCTDAEGRPGSWQEGPGASDAVAVPLPSGGPARVTLSVRDPNPLDVLNLGLARTYRLELRTYLQQTPGTGPAAVGNGGFADDVEYTAPFDVTLAPSAAYQVDVLPYTIVYAPPGDQSSEDYTIASSYGTSLSVASTTNRSNSITDQQDSSVKASFKATFGVPLFTSAEIDMSGTQSWDTTTSYGFGRTAMSQTQQSSVETFSQDLGGPAVDPLQTPGDGQVCAVKTGATGLPTPDCSQVSQAPNGDYWHEPFWRDTFYLLVHPQFAAWSYNGQERDVLLGAVPGLFSIDVRHLALCAAGVPTDAAGVPSCQLAYNDVSRTSGGYTSHSGTLNLSADEAANLLLLDPFYSGGGQSAPLDPKRFTPVSGTGTTFNYGAYASSDATDGDIAPLPKAEKFTLQSSTQVTQGGSTTFTSVVTDTVGSQFTVGGQLNAGSCSAGECASLGISYTTGESNKTQQQLQVTYQDSTATSQQNATQTSATLNDVDNIDLAGNGSPACPKSCHAPLLHQPTVAVYLDNMFGGYAFQDPAAPTHIILHVVPAGWEVGNILNVLKELHAATGQTSGGSHFGDVPPGFWAGAAIQTLVGRGIVSGFPDGTFRPDAPLTRAQFLKLLVLTLGLKPASAATPFTDVGASDWFAPYVAAAVQAGLARGVSANRFDPGGTVTREEMAVLLARALRLSGSSALPFSDAAAVDGWAVAGIQAAVAAGYLSGLPGGSFDPRGPTTRAQAAKVLALALQNGAAPGP
jgi:hypothetical protein